MCFRSGRRRRSNRSADSTRRPPSSRSRTTLSSMTPRSPSPCVPVPRSSARWDRDERSPSDASDCSTQASCLTSLLNSQHRLDWIWARVPARDGVVDPRGSRGSPPRAPRPPAGYTTRAHTRRGVMTSCFAGRARGGGSLITAEGAADWAVDAASEQADNLRTPPMSCYIRHVIASNAITMTVTPTTSSCCPSRSQLESFGLLTPVCTVHDLDHSSRERRSVHMAAGANHLNRVIPSHLIVWHARRALADKEAVPIGSQAVRNLANHLSGSQRQPKEQA